MTFDSDQLTLTCISTGGPATTVTWTRDNVNITGEQNETVLNDSVTAQYTHTLTVTTAGVYTCTVSNNKPSSATSTSITVQGDYLKCFRTPKLFFLFSWMNIIPWKAVSVCGSLGLLALLCGVDCF